MPPRTDLRKILLIGSGPIRIGQACEFDYSGVQACKALSEEGYEVILVNSNPATIMTDPELASRTYIEPLDPEIVEKIVERERPDALLSTVGGQTGINIAVELAREGVLDAYGVELIGAGLRPMELAEDRKLFRQEMMAEHLEVVRGKVASSVEEAESIRETIGLPLIIRPFFTLGGWGGGVVYNDEDYLALIDQGLSMSPVHRVLVEESVLGWKEYELELMRDSKDNVVVVCTIENLDPMGIHTGDSITVAPAQTLSDREYQMMRDAAIRVMRRVGVETGGANIQFAIHPENGRMVVIEMNPRVSRSSALASKATGFPIAKIAAKLAIGYTLDELPNEITQATPASFEPTLDYVVVKVPRWAFEKFPVADATLTSRMKSVGEVMAIGRNFREALQKGIRSLEIGRPGLSSQEAAADNWEQQLHFPTCDRLFHLYSALLHGEDPENLTEWTKIDPWYLFQIGELVKLEQRIQSHAWEELPDDLLLRAKQEGFSDAQLSRFFRVSEGQIRAKRKAIALRPVYKKVDTCGAEFPAVTPYFYSTYEEECESEPTLRKKVIILGSGPNRIGQGIEFDYCCCQASYALREEQYESILVNCNPETVSTDYDTSDRLYFEPLTLEDVLHVYEKERPLGIIVQYGGQTPLNLALELKEAGIRILGTQPESIDLAEDRERFGAFLDRLDLQQPRHGIATTKPEAMKVAESIGYPVLLRPSYVLGGRAMVVVHDAETLEFCLAEAFRLHPDRAILIDEFLENALEFDVDAIADGECCYIGGILQHIEQAGIHSGDSACLIPPSSVDGIHLEEIRRQTALLARHLDVRGLMNVQFALQNEKLYVLEVNPRASRTVPFVSKALGIPLAKIATKVLLGRRLSDLGYQQESQPLAYCVKAVVNTFLDFPEEDPILGPEMRSTGEVMGIDESFGKAFAKAQLAAGHRLPTRGAAFLSVDDKDKERVLSCARRLRALGFSILATQGTNAYLAHRGIASEFVFKVNEGRPNVVDLIRDGSIQLVINTPLGRESLYDEVPIRKSAVRYRVPCFTTISGAEAAIDAIQVLQEGDLSVRSLQEYQSGDSASTGSSGRRSLLAEELSP